MVFESVDRGLDRAFLLALWNLRGTDLWEELSVVGRPKELPFFCVSSCDTSMPKCPE